MKKLPLFRLFIFNIIISTSKEHMFDDERTCEIMNRQELIERIEKLTPEQFEMLIDLWTQQEQESVPTSQSDRQTSLRPCG